MLTSSRVLLFAVFTAMTGQGLCGRAEVNRRMVYERAVIADNRNFKYVRPDAVDGDTGPVRVNVSYELNSVSDVDRRLSYVDTVGYLKMSWTDSRLAYGAPTRAHGVSGLLVDVSQIWTPDIELFNAAPPGIQYLNRREQAVVGPTGSVLWVPQVAVRSLCSIPSGRLTTPFNCTLSFGSWTYDGLQIDLVAESPEVGVSRLVDSRHWMVVSSSVVRKQTVYLCCPEPYFSLEITLTIQHC